MKRRTFLGLGAGTLAAAAAGGTGLGYAAHRVNRIGRYDAVSLAALRGGATSPLFERFPALTAAVPWLPIGRLPTPLQRLELDGSAAALLLVKRDDLASPLYGGNKVRKLEHVLAEARLLGAGTVVTVGAIGSNHGLATALHGREHGFAVELGLFDQPVTPVVRRNVSGFVHAGAQLRPARSVAGALLEAGRAYNAARRAGGRPYFIMPGGSSRLGNIGFVTAALELAAQIRAGELPEPDRIFVALGTCGTMAGLVAGLRIAGLRTRVTGVRVADPLPANGWTVRYLAQDVADWLHAQDATVPPLRIADDDFAVATGYFGRGYGVATREGDAAVRWAAPRMTLETTYTGKALAACLDYCRGPGAGETVLFWNTYNSAPVSQAPSLDTLPAALRRVFGA